MEKLKSPKAIAVASTALFFASLFWLVNTNRVNSSLDAGLQKQKLKSEKLLSEKLLQEKDIQKFKDQLATLKDQNSSLDDLVKSTSEKFKRREFEYNRMRRENTSLAQARKQR